MKAPLNWLLMISTTIGLVACQQGTKLDLTKDGMDPSQAFHDLYSQSELFDIDDDGRQIQMSSSSDSQQARGIAQVGSQGYYQPLDPFRQFANAVRAWRPSVAVVSYVLFGREDESSGQRKCTRLRNVKLESNRPIIVLRSSAGITNPTPSFTGSQSITLNGDNSGTSSGLGGVIIAIDGEGSCDFPYPTSQPWFQFDDFAPPSCGGSYSENITLKVTGKLKPCEGESGPSQNLDADIGQYFSTNSQWGGYNSMPYFNIDQGKYMITGRAIRFGGQQYNWWY